MKRPHGVMLFFPLLVASAGAQVGPYEDGWVEEALRGLPGFAGGVSARVMEEPERYKLQVLVAEVAGDPPRLVRHGFRVDAEYFYPASTIKLCAAIAACAELERLGTGVDAGSRPSLDTPIRIGSAFGGHEPVEEDPSNLAGGRVTLGHEIRKLFIVSDNPAFNRLYDFVGRDRLNTLMWDAGLSSVRIRHRLSVARTEEQNRLTPEVVSTDERVALRVGPRRGELDLAGPAIPGLRVGDAHLSGGERVEGPLDFSGKNAISLVHLQDALVKLARPDIDFGTPGFDLSDEHRAFMLEAMRVTPRESQNPRYDPDAYPDDYVKFLLPGLRRVEGGERLVVRGKVGLAYGFVIENSYVSDPRTGRACFVTATIYTNSNGVLNDNVYDYDTVALPFMADLGEAVARHLLAD